MPLILHNYISRDSVFGSSFCSVVTCAFTPNSYKNCTLLYLFTVIDKKRQKRIAITIRGIINIRFEFVNTSQNSFSPITTYFASLCRKIAKISACCVSLN